MALQVETVIWTKHAMNLAVVIKTPNLFYYSMIGFKYVEQGLVLEKRAKYIRPF